MTADALKTITTPSTTSDKVEPNSHLSIPNRFAIQEIAKNCQNCQNCQNLNRDYCFLRQRLHQLFENPSALLVIFKLIEAGTCRRQKHDVARNRSF